MDCKWFRDVGRWRNSKHNIIGGEICKVDPTPRSVKRRYDIPNVSKLASYSQSRHFSLQTELPTCGGATQDDDTQMFVPAWLSMAQAFKTCRLDQSCQLWLRSARLWPKPWPMGVNCTINQIYWIQTYSVKFVYTSGDVYIQSYTDYVYAYCGLVMMYQAVKNHSKENALTILNDCQQKKKMNILIHETYLMFISNTHCALILTS